MTGVDWPTVEAAAPIIESVGHTIVDFVERQRFDRPRFRLTTSGLS